MTVPALTRCPSAEKAVNDRLVQTPDLYLLALAQFAIAADTEVASSQSVDMIAADQATYYSASSADEILLLGAPPTSPLSLRTPATAKRAEIDPLRSALFTGVDHPGASPPSFALP